MMSFLVVIEVDEILFVGGERGARCDHFTSRYSGPWRWIHASDGFMDIDVYIRFVYDLSTDLVSI